jgi:hypothetical protein
MQRFVTSTKYCYFGVYHLLHMGALVQERVTCRRGDGIAVMSKLGQFDVA